MKICLKQALQNQDLAKLKTIYMGTGEIGIPTLTALLDSPKHEVLAAITQPDRPAGRNLTVCPSRIKTLALARGVPLLQPEKLRKDLDPLLALKPDLIVVMAYGQILPAAILQLPTVACLNLHASLLPKHRGASPIHAALLAGDQETGITVMYMAEGLDSGDVLLKESFPIAARENTGQLHDRLAQVAPQALMKALELLKQGKAPRIPQDSALATYAPKLSKEDARLHWSETAELLDRRVRAMNPWPGAFCWWPAEAPASTAAAALLRLKVLEALPHKSEEEKLTSSSILPTGKVIFVGEQGIEVQCAQGSSLLLCQVQLEGRKIMSAAEFARGYSVCKGMQFA